MEAVVNHLWQSTAFAVAIAAICRLLRGRNARARFWVWLAASIKFLIPFSLLVSAGDRLELPVVHTPMVSAMAVEAISTTFSPAPMVVPGESFGWLQLLLSIWFAGVVILTAGWIRQYLRLRAVVRAAARADVAFPIEVRITPAPIEPGIVGLVRPVLLLPAGLGGVLSIAEFQAILAHEHCHVRYRDNLTAALHMIVSALFWYHPLVWWIGANLLRERERACDESVLREGSRAEVYAQGIVNVCRFYVESPLPCTSGVTGADLKQRIGEIMTNRFTAGLTKMQKLGLAMAASCAVLLPTVVGVLRSQTLPPPPAYRYDVATIRPSAPGDPSNRIGPGPQGGMSSRNTTVMQLLHFAYNLQEFQFDSVPGWVKSDRFDVTFTPEGPELTASPTMARADMEGLINRNRQRLQAVLRDRFQLVLRVEKRDQPYLALTAMKGGHKLTPTAADGPPTGMQTRPGRLTAKRVYMYMLTGRLGAFLGRHVENETGLDGPFDFEMTWTPTDGAQEATDVDRSAIVSALREQLGLKLESRRGPVPVHVIERIEKPSDN